MACNDVVVEILCRLPGKDLIRCKCVCRAWHRLICEVCIPRFTLNPPLSCLSVEVKTRGLGTPTHGRFKHEEVGEEESGGLTRFIVNSWGTLPSYHSSGRFLDSCNGLLLFCRHVRPYYYVCNPTTREFMPLRGTFVHTERSAALAFDPCKSPHYKVVRFTPSGKTRVVMHVYSSESRRWTGHILPLDHLTPLAGWYHKMVFFNGTIYRLSDPSHLLCFDLDIVNARRIDLPKSPTFLVRGTLGVSSGHLCFARLNIDELNVWSLDDQCEGGEWILKHRVTYDFEKEVPISLRPRPQNCLLACCGIHPNSDIIFIGTDRMILSYDFKSNTVKEVFRTREGLCFAYPVYTHVQCLASFAKAGTRIFDSIHSAIVYDDIQTLNKSFEDRECIKVPSRVVKVLRNVANKMHLHLIFSCKS